MAFYQLVLFLLFLCTSTCSSQSVALTPTGEFCNNNTKINTKSLVVSLDIDIVLAKLVAAVPKNGFSTASISQVHGVAQCRGDVSSMDCFLCIQDAAKQIRQRCPDQADSRIWYDTCFLRYNTYNFSGQVDTSIGILITNVENVTEPNEVFSKKLGVLVEKVRSEAVAPVNKGFGSGEVKLSGSDSLYGLVQCIRNLSPVSCAQCLDTAVGQFSSFCNGKKGCRVLYSSCYARYEMYPFFTSS